MSFSLNYSDCHSVIVDHHNISLLFIICENIEINGKQEKMYASEINVKLILVQMNFFIQM